MGNGQATWDSIKNRYFVDLAVTAQYDAVTALHKSRWRKSFQHASKILFKATNGHMQLGSIQFLNDGPSSADDDVVLHNAGTESGTPGGTSPFDHQITLVPHVMKEPVVIVHELGHYIALLGDEYLGLLRRCQNNAATHQCIMEFGQGFGLRLDNAGNPSTAQPIHTVNQFCFTNHQAIAGNEQEIKNGESCWQTLKDHYSQLTLPGGKASSNTHKKIEWIDRAVTSKYALVIPPSDAFTQPQVELAIKASAKQLVHRVAFSGDQLAIIIGSQGLLHQMNYIAEADIDTILAKIDNADLSEGKAKRWTVASATDQFRNPQGAYQRMILLADGNSNLDLTTLGRTLIEKRISLVARAYGRGELDSQLERLNESSKWISHESFPILPQQFDAYEFGLQNEMIQLYFANTPGYGIVDMQSGRLPAIHKASVLNLVQSSQSSEAEKIAVVQEINLEHRDRGVDLPVWIDEEAESVTFLMSEPVAGGIEFTLVAPNGNEIFQPKTSPTGPSNVVWFDLTEKLTGRWLLRLRRKKGSDELPFFLLTAVRNRHLRTSAEVKVSENKIVKLRCQTVYRFPLDSIQTVVDIVRLQPDTETPSETVASIVLKRERKMDGQTKKYVDVSTGMYVGEISLVPGAYIAKFQVQHHGQAIYASNPGGNIHGNVMEYVQRPIPPFARQESHRFEVP